MARWLLAVALDWSLIAAAVAAFGLTPWPWCFIVLPPAVLLIACRQHALLILGHEAVHGLVPEWLGDVLTFAPFGVSIASFRAFHLAHHTHLGTPMDPERLGREEFARLGVGWGLPRSPRRFWLEVALSLAGVRSYAMVAYAWLFRPRAVEGVGLVVAWWGVALAALYATGAWWVLALWAGPMLTALWALLWFRVWTEHTGTTGTHRLRLTWWQSFILLPHGIWYHYEHHAFPAVPFWHLPAVRQSYAGPRAVTLGELFRSFNGV